MADALNEEIKRPYPRLVINNKAKLTIFNGTGIFMQLFLPSREDAKNTLAEISARFGKEPIYDIRDC